MNLTDNDHELLSAYLDGMLADDELHTLEQRLRQDPDLQRELQGLQQTIALVKSLPIRKAPRSFALTPEMVDQTDRPALEVLESRRKPSRIIQFPTVSILSAVASLILALAGLSLLFSSMNEPSSTKSTDNRMETVGMMANSAPQDAVAVRPTSDVELPAVDNLLDTARAVVPEETTLGYASGTLDLTVTQMVPGAVAAPVETENDSDTMLDEQQNNVFAPEEPLPSGETRDRNNISATVLPGTIEVPSTFSDVAQTQMSQSVITTEQEEAATGIFGDTPPSAPLIMQATGIQSQEGSADDAAEEMESADLFDTAPNNTAAMAFPSPMPTQKLPTEGGDAGTSGGMGGQNFQMVQPSPTAMQTATVTITASPVPSLVPTTVAMADGSGSETGQEDPEVALPDEVISDSPAADSNVQNQITLGGVLLALGGLMLAFAAFTYLRQQGE